MDILCFLAHPVRGLRDSNGMKIRRSIIMRFRFLPLVKIRAELT
jgi:hypothetical protein